jgi:hypothetical protein
MDRTARLKFLGWWLLIGLIAAGACALKWPATHFSDESLPYGNDSFYHARRILDTVADPSAFYQFDPKIHAPEGSLLTWPWGYDYAMAMLVKLGELLGIAAPPIAILVWLPVLAVLLPIGLIMLIARRLGLSQPLAIIAGLATALLPLTQFLYGVGQIDHHFAEHIFVLATIAAGLRWCARPQDTRAAVALGIVLGAAPAIHNGLFILQLPVLATLLASWFQGARMPMRTTLQFAAALILTTLAVLMPSLPFRLGLFEFYTLSWFHLYVAGGSAIAALALAHLEPSRRNFAVLAAIALVLLVPLAHQILIARAFLGGTIERLEHIVEMKTPASMIFSPTGRQDLTQMYSAFVWLVPLTAIYCAWQGWRERASPRLFFWICCICGLALLLAQLRMHYFGSFALYLPWLFLAQYCIRRWPDKNKLVTLLASTVFVLMYWIPGRYQLAGPTDFVGDSSFRALRPILEDLKHACARDPGIVLADNDAGHYIRYYTECSVIANNFLLTPQHEQKVRQMDYLMSVPAGAFPGVAPFVRYILVRPITILRESDRTRYMSFSPQAAQLVEDLLLKPLDQVPSNYVLIEQANIRETGASGDYSVPYIRLFKMDPVAPRSAQSTSTATAPSLNHVGK